MIKNCKNQSIESVRFNKQKLPIGLDLKEKNSINQLIYSNNYGFMIICLKNQILIQDQIFDFDIENTYSLEVNINY